MQDSENGRCARCGQPINSGERAHPYGEQVVCAACAAEPAPVVELTYATPEPREQRPGWVVAVVTAYLVLLLGVLSLPGLAAWNEWSDVGLAVVGVFVFFLLGFGLVAVPVRMRRGRPVARAAIWQPLVAAALCFAALCFAVAIATIELIKSSSDAVTVAIVVPLAAAWVTWVVLFAFMARSTDPLSLSGRLYKALLAGSLLELLVAVPMHLIVRRRSECCAGMMTGAAIGLGVLVGLVALGPGMFLLYHRRWAEKYRARPGD